MITVIEHEQDQNDFRLMRLLEWAGSSITAIERQVLTGGSSVDWSMAAGPCLTLGPRALTGAGVERPLLQIRGYVWPTANRHLIPTVSPSFIQRGNAKLSAAFINDVQKAMLLDSHGMPPQLVDYALDPLPWQALDWAREYTRQLAADPSIRLAFDIETPGKGEDEEDVDTDSDAPDRTWRIERIGFAYKPLHALSVPWEPPYMAAIKLLMASAGDKVVWNAGFDVPRIKRAGVPINGIVHDGMVAWHILHSDLPKRLGFVATFTCPWQPAWKHLSGARPAFYNATDADVEIRSMIAIEAELKKVGLWDVYVRDVVELEPILIHMQTVGMPIDAAVRLDRATKLSEELVRIKSQLQAAIPLEARKVEKVFKKTPKDINGLQSRPATRLTPVCALCGHESPRRDHFKRYVKKHNPCADGSVQEVQKVITEYYRLAEWTPSRDQMVRYHAWLKRPVPTVWDKKSMSRKVSFGEREIKVLMGKYPQDQVYKLILDYRKLDKLAGTYVGRVNEG